MVVGKGKYFYFAIALASMIFASSHAFAAAEKTEKAAAGKKEEGSKEKSSFMVKRIEGSLPSDPWDAAWDQGEVFTVPVTGQAAIQPRLFVSSVKEMKVRALHNDRKIAFVLEYKDATKDLDYNGSSDAVAIMFPTQPLPARAHLYMGESMLQVESSTANIWHWKAKDNKGYDLLGEGIVNPPTMHEKQSVTANGVWKNGMWRVMFTRDVEMSDPDYASFSPAKFANISFATWDAKKGEQKSLHGVTAWYYMIPEAPPDSSIYLYGLIGLVVAGVAEFVVVKRIQKNRSDS